MNFITLKTFYKREFIIIFFLSLSLLLPSEVYSLKKRKIISGIEVKVYKKEKKHIETSALLCALYLNGNSFEEIRKILEFNFQKPISSPDQFLLTDIMQSMCPEFEFKKLIENSK